MCRHSLASVLCLNEVGVGAGGGSPLPPLASGSGPRPQPPLQRLGRAHIARAKQNTEADCVKSHVTQLQAHHKGAREQRRADRRGHREEMRDLRNKFDASFQEHAARKAMESNLREEHERERVDKRTREIVDHRRAYSEDTFWPFERDARKGAPDLAPAAYGEHLLEQVGEQGRAAEAAAAARRTSSEEAAGLDPRRSHRSLVGVGVGGAGLSPLDGATFYDARRARDAAAQAIGMARATARHQAVSAHNARVKAGQGMREAAQATIFEGMQQREIGRQLKQQRDLANALTDQIADKRKRELRQHAEMHGEHPTEAQIVARLEAQVKNEVGRREAQDARDEAAARRAELQALIAEKQAERRAMKKAHQAAEDARDARAKAAVLLEHELAEQKGRERKAELDLAWQKQEIDLSRARKREAREKKAGRDYGGVKS